MGAARAIVLDFNGTLAQDDAIVLRVYGELFASLGLSASEYQAEIAALRDREIVDLALRLAGVDGDDELRGALLETRVARYLEAVGDAPPIDAPAAAFVRAAAQQVPLAIASGAFRREIDHVLGLAGLANSFAAIVTGEDVVRGKPDPEGFARALELLNAALQPDPPIRPEETVAIEDSTGGARAARAAGMRVVAIDGPAYDPSSGYAKLTIDRLEPDVLPRVLSVRAAA